MTFYGALAVLAAWTSLGPAGGLYPAFFRLIPLFAFLRAPGRFSILVTLALVVPGSLAVAGWRGARRGGGSVSPRFSRSSWRQSLRRAPLIPEVNPSTDAVYTALARLRRAPVVELPFFYNRPDFPRHASYMLNSTAHWMPLVNGYSDHIPEDFRAMVIDMSSFPTRASFRLLEERHVRYVVFHLRLYDSRSREKLLGRIQDYGEFLAPILRNGDVWLYEITSWPK